MSQFYDFKVKTIDGEEQSLKDFQGKTVLVTNVASKCGLTPQYAGLEALYRKYKDKAFTVLGLPCNQFAEQEPAPESEIKSFCTTKYDVTFPMTSKIEVNGAGQHPLYAWLTGTDAAFPGDISWNFEKFLISKNGEVIKRFGPKVTPEDQDLVAEIDKSIS